MVLDKLGRRGWGKDVPSFFLRGSGVDHLSVDTHIHPCIHPTQGSIQTHQHSQCNMLWSGIWSVGWLFGWLVIVMSKRTRRRRLCKFAQY